MRSVTVMIAKKPISRLTSANALIAERMNAVGTR